VHEGRWHFTVQRPERNSLDIALAIPGRHNVLNALAAVTVATDEGLEDDAIAAGLAEFRGVSRRFQVSEAIILEGKSITLVDDYGHHPTEVEAVISTARDMWPERRLVMAYQPHRYSRTHDLYDDFVRVLSGVDALVLLEVYAAGETPIPGADGKSLCQGIRQRGDVLPVFASDPDEALTILAGLVKEGDTVIVQGAGNVNRISNLLTEVENE
jgi:UDP-N-acetylmuramate--alanine ligase